MKITMNDPKQAQTEPLTPGKDGWESEGVYVFHYQGLTFEVTEGSSGERYVVVNRELGDKIKEEHIDPYNQELGITEIANEDSYEAAFEHRSWFETRNDYDGPGIYNEDGEKTEYADLDDAWWAHMKWMMEEDDSTYEIDEWIKEKVDAGELKQTGSDKFGPTYGVAEEGKEGMVDDPGMERLEPEKS